MPENIHYVEDDIRRQFFRDHPFESFRPVSIVERGGVADEHPIRGKAWSRLRQRGRNPSPDDAIKYAVTLFHHHDNITLSEAYARAVAQFRALRAEHQTATTFATMEADHFAGRAPGTWGPTEVEHAFAKEQKSLESWDRDPDMDEGSIAARKRWKMIAEKRATEPAENKWEAGKAYVRKREEGARPDYSLEAFRAQAVAGSEAGAEEGKTIQPPRSAF